MAAVTKTHRRYRSILFLSLLLLLFTILLSVARIWLLDVTAPAPRPHQLLGLTLPGLDIGADAWPAQTDAAGYVEVWIEPHDADDIQTILQIEGSPAQPDLPRQRPRLRWTWAQIHAARSALPIAQCGQAGRVA